MQRCNQWHLAILGAATFLLAFAVADLPNLSLFTQSSVRTAHQVSAVAPHIVSVQRSAVSLRQQAQDPFSMVDLTPAEDAPKAYGTLVTGAALSVVFVAGYLAGCLFQRKVAMAAYQSEYSRFSMALRAAASDEDLTKKLNDLKKEVQDKMESALEATATKFNSVRTGRASPALLDRIRVEYYGSLTPLKQVAGVSTPDASTIVISPFDRSSITAIEKAISGSDVGLTPSNDGQVIRIKVPPLTEDRRKEMVKTVAKMGEEGKVAIRNVRRDILKAADKLKLSENAEAGFKDDVQKTTDKFVKKLDELIAAKEKDLTTV